MVKRKQFLALLLSVLLCLSLGMPALGAEGTTQTLAPFAFSHAMPQTDSVRASGATLENPIVFSMGYTGTSNGYTGVATYHLKGQYQTMKFKAGYLDGSQRDANLSVIVDGEVKVDSASVSYENVAKTYEIPVSGAQQVIIQFESNGYDRTRYAIGNVQLISASEVAPDEILASDENYDSLRYLLSNATVADTFSMGGYDYKGGYILSMGYTGSSSGYTGKVGFSFEGTACESISFDVARLMSGDSVSNTRSAYLTIEVDGTALEDYSERELKWNDISLPITIDLKGVSQLLIIVTSNGYDRVSWSIGNIHIAGNEPQVHVHSLTAIAEVPATCEKSGTAAYWTCADCGKLFSDAEGTKEISEPDTIPATGHHWGKWTTVKEASVSAEGLRQRVCSNDASHVETEAIPKLTPTPTPKPTPTPAPTNFTDVKETEYYAEPVDWAVKNGVTAGISATSFAPAADCTRAQVVTFLWRTNGAPKASGTNPFKDVSSSAYYYDAVMWAVSKGITQGTSATTFSPEASCTRAHVVTFLWRAEGTPKPTVTRSSFTDVAANAYYASAVLWAVEKNITQGTSATTFSPNATCSRAQIVTFLYRDMTRTS